MAPRAKKTANKSKGAKRSPAEDERQLGEVLSSLEGIVGELEGGELPLEQALERFEAGVRDARKAGAMLDAVEQRVEMLLAEQAEPVPFADKEVDA